MSETVETDTVGPLRIEVRWEEYGETFDPRDWDNLGTMVCGHRNYRLGDVQGTEDDVPEAGPDVVALPLYLFDHSGLSMSTSTQAFSAADSMGWDWGQVGVIYATRADAEAYGTPWDRVEDVLRSEVETYDLWLRGSVFYYLVFDPDGHVIESCGGYITDNTEEVLEEGRNAARWTEDYRRWEQRVAVQVAGIGL